MVRDQTLSARFHGLFCCIIQSIGIFVQLEQVKISALRTQAHQSAVYTHLLLHRAPVRAAKPPTTCGGSLCWS